MPTSTRYLTLVCVVTILVGTLCVTTTYCSEDGSEYEGAAPQETASVEPGGHYVKEEKIIRRYDPDGKKPRTMPGKRRGPPGSRPWAANQRWSGFSRNRFSFATTTLPNGEAPVDNMHVYHRKALDKNTRRGNRRPKRPRITTWNVNRKNPCWRGSKSSYPAPLPAVERAKQRMRPAGNRMQWSRNRPQPGMWMTPADNSVETPGDENYVADDIPTTEVQPVSSEEQTEDTGFQDANEGEQKESDNCSQDISDEGSEQQLPNLSDESNEPEESTDSGNRWTAPDLAPKRVVYSPIGHMYPVRPPSPPMFLPPAPPPLVPQYIPAPPPPPPPYMLSPQWQLPQHIGPSMQMAPPVQPRLAMQPVLLAPPRPPPPPPPPPMMLSGPMHPLQQDMQNLLGGGTKADDIIFKLRALKEAVSGHARKTPVDPVIDSLVDEAKGMLEEETVSSQLSSLLSPQAQSFSGFAAPPAPARIFRQASKQGDEK